jgi:rhodanese-related sulfurtransferase
MDITVLELKERIEAGEALHFIDVREEHEYEEFNLGAMLIPLGDLADRLDEIEGWKAEEVIVHCRSGARSGRAKAFLEAEGFENVRNLLGGVLAWNEM